ncbi:MAG: hypothetical protein R3B93_10115 [Bacteroidia bacterium]
MSEMVYFYANLKDNQLSFKPTPTMIISGQLNHRVRVVQDVILHLKEFESDKIISKSKASYSGTYSFAIPEREDLDSKYIRECLSD